MIEKHAYAANLWCTFASDKHDAFSFLWDCISYFLHKLYFMQALCIVIRMCLIHIPHCCDIACINYVLCRYSILLYRCVWYTFHIIVIFLAWIVFYAGTLLLCGCVWYTFRVTVYFVPFFWIVIWCKCIGWDLDVYDTHSNLWFIIMLILWDTFHTRDRLLFLYWC